jgi:hypothetical protein
MTGKPTFPAALSRALGSPIAPGTTGTPAFSASFLAEILWPSAEIASGEGPMKAKPRSRQSFAKEPFSERNP